METHGSFQFGVEIELLMGSRKKVHPNWKSLAKDLSKRLQKAGISNHVNDGNDKSRENYREWSIVQEVTIPSQPAKNLWGLELVSPVYPVYSYWASDLDTIFATLHSAYTLTPSPHCSTHVHVSGAPSALTTAELAALAKSALYYEPAIDLLVPPSRRASTAYWCQSNRASPSLRDRTSLSDCLAAVNRAAAGANNPRAVVEAMNLFPASSAYGRAHGKTRDFVRGKVYKWDFSRMLLGSGQHAGAATVEFRQPPGSVVADEAAAWVTLAVAFVAGAVGGGAIDDAAVARDGGASAEELWRLLWGGALALGWEGLGGVEGLFEKAV